LRQLNSEIVKIIDQPEVRELISRQGANPVGNTSEEFGAYVKAEISKWAKIIKESGAKAE